MDEKLIEWLKENFPHFYESFQQDVKNLGEGIPIDYDMAVVSLEADLIERKKENA